jgi:hypothetical protein
VPVTALVSRRQPEPAFAYLGDYSRPGKPTSLIRCFAPALLQSIAASLISDTRQGGCFSFSSKILAFSSHHIVALARLEINLSSILTVIEGVHKL